MKSIIIKTLHKNMCVLLCMTCMINVTDIKPLFQTHDIEKNHLTTASAQTILSVEGDDIEAPPVMDLTDEEIAVAEQFQRTKVTGLTIVKKSEKNVSLTWTESDRATSYTIYRSNKKSEGYTTIGTVKENSFTDLTAKKYKKYYYRVQAQMVIREFTFAGEMSDAKYCRITTKTPKTVIAGECFVVDMVGMKKIFKKNHHFVAKIGVNTYTMQNSNYFNYKGKSITGLERIAYYKPDRVYFLIGANEAAWTTPSFTIKNYKKMFKLLKKINKNIEIVLVKIPPFATHSSQNIPSVSRRAKFNKAYKNFVKKNKNTYYCDATDVLGGGTEHLLRKYDAGDGCHWNMKGTEAVVKKMRKWSKKRFGNW